MVVVIKKTQPAKECESCERFIMGKCVIGESDKLPNNCLLANLTRKQADVVEVVRCKDCIYAYETIGGWCCSHGICVDCIVREDFYCADGTRGW